MFSSEIESNEALLLTEMISSEDLACLKGSKMVIFWLLVPW